MPRPFSLVPAATLLGLALFAGAAQAVTLKIGTLVPAGTSIIQELRAAGATIAERTGGRIELQLFPGGVMGDDRTVLRKMRIGQLHGAVVSSNGLARIHPDAQVYSLPFLFRSYDELAYVRERIDPVIRERVASEGYVPAGISEGGFTYLFSKAPVRGLEDLEEARVWVPQGDEITARMFDRAGARPVALPVSDVFTSLQSGMIDTTAITPSGAIALQWHTGVNYQTDAPLLFLFGMLVFDERALARLEADDRAVVLEVMAATFERMDRINREDNREAMTVLRDRGIDLVEPARPPAERRWEDIAHETLESLEREGDFDADLLERVRALLDEYRGRPD